MRRHLLRQGDADTSRAGGAADGADFASREQDHDGIVHGLSEPRGATFPLVHEHDHGDLADFLALLVPSYQVCREYDEQQQNSHPRELGERASPFSFLVGHDVPPLGFAFGILPWQGGAVNDIMGVLVIYQGN